MSNKKWNGEPATIALPPEPPLAFRLAVKEGLVRMEFNRQINWIGFTPADAQKLGATLMEIAHMLQTQVAPGASPDAQALIDAPLVRQ